MTPDGSEKVELTREKETLLVPLYGKATERRIIHDPTAEAILEKVDYDFSGLRIPWITQVTMAMRANRFDSYARDSAALVVLHLGCGLDSRVDRVRSDALWYDLDYPDVIELRRRFYGETERARMIGCSVTDHSWMDRVDSDGPALIIAEGLLMYLHPNEVRDLLLALRERFPGSEIAFDVLSPLVVRRRSRHPSMRKTGAEWHWAVDDPAEVRALVPGMELLDEWSFADSTDIARLPFGRRLMMRLAFALPVARKTHRILRFRLG